MAGRGIILALAAGLAAGTAGAQDRVAAGTEAGAGRPMSAIDWLSDSVVAPVAVALPPGGVSGAAPGGEPATATTARPEDVTVSTIPTTSPDAAGLLPVSVSGLPQALWGPTAAGDLGRLIRGERADMIPALQGLLLRILLAELDAPFDSDARGTLFLARLDKLLDIGALDQADALIDRVGAASDPQIFRRAFDIQLLLGTEDRGCATLASDPALSPTYPARVFCLARNGDWDMAALTLGTARALGYVSDTEDALLSRFLDPDLYEGEPVPRLKGPMTPLTFRMLEAIGEPLPTTTLPRAFAHADLGPNVGWKSQIEAAERLAQVGALAPAALEELYSQRRPAASGGVWDRVAAFQALDAALVAKDAKAVAGALQPAWDEMALVDLEPALAAMTAPRLKGLTLDGAAAALAFRLALLTPEYEAAAQARSPADATEAFLAGLARGEVAGLMPPDATAAAIADGFAAKGPPLRARPLLAGGRTGEAMLRAMDLVTMGATGELDELADGLALLRALGLEDTARQAALQILILDRRG